MAYTKTTWVDEVLAGPERFKILDNVGVAADAFADLANCQIQLNVGINTTGTAVNAANMNNIENGIYDLSRGVALSVKGITGNATGDVADIAAGVDGYVLRRSGTALAFGQIATAGIADLAVTSAKLASGAVTAGKIATGGISASTQFASGVVDAAAIANRSRGLWVAPREYVTLNDGAQTSCYGIFLVPKDFVSGLSVKAIGLRSGVSTGNMVFRVTINYGAVGEASNTHTNSVSQTTVAVNNDYWMSLLSCDLTSIALGDIVSIQFERLGNDPSDTNMASFIIHGFYVEYTADS